MTVTETITRECCQPKDLKPVDGVKKYGEWSAFMFCVHCGARHAYICTNTASGSFDSYRKIPEMPRMITYADFIARKRRAFQGDGLPAEPR